MKKSLFLKNAGAFLLILVFLAPPIAAFGQSVLPDNPGLPDGSIYDIVKRAMDWLLAIFGFLAIIGFVISGILYLTAAGNDTQIKTAKTAMTYSIVGVIVALSGYVVMKAVEALLSAGPEI